MSFKSHQFTVILIEVIQEQSEILEVNYADNRKIIENQFFDEDGNFFNSMLKSFASGISSIKGSPLDLDKIHNQPTTKNSPYCDLNIKTPIDKKKLFGNFKQTSSSLLRKAQAMNKPIHSNRKLFENDEEVKPPLKNKNHPLVELTNKENNCANEMYAGHRMTSPIPSVKGTWAKNISPTPVEKFTKASSPDTAYYKSPFVVLQPNPNMRSVTKFDTPLNGLKGSLVAPST